MIKLIFYFVVIQVVLLIPNFYFFRKFLTKKLGSKHIKMRSILATVLVPTLLTVLMIGICYGIINPILRSKEFYSNDWIQTFKQEENYIVHGELQVTKLNKDGLKKWGFGGADMLVSIDS